MRRGLLVAAFAGLAAGVAAGVAAQGRPPLNLKLQPVTEGAVAAILAVDSSNTRIPTPSAQARPGQPAEVSGGPPVGAVAVLPLGKESDHKWKFGAAGTPEMKPYLDGAAQEVVVVMDDGERRSFRPREPARFRIGQRVTVQSGELEPATMRKDGS
jgi:hypothetical protein